MMTDKNLGRGRRFNGLRITRGHIFLFTLLCVCGSVNLLDTKDILDVVKGRNEKVTESLEQIRARLQSHEDLYKAWVREYDGLADALFVLENFEPSAKPHVDSIKESMKQAHAFKRRIEGFYDEVRKIEDEVDLQNKQIKCLKGLRDKL